MRRSVPGQGEPANGVQSGQAVTRHQQQQRQLRVHQRQQDVRRHGAARAPVPARRARGRNRCAGNKSSCTYPTYASLTPPLLSSNRQHHIQNGR